MQSCALFTTLNLFTTGSIDQLHPPPPLRPLENDLLDSLITLGRREILPWNGTPSSNTLTNMSLKLSSIRLHCCCCLLIQWIIRIWRHKQEIQPHCNRANGKHWLPVFSKNIQAHIPLKVNIGVVYFGEAFNFGRFMWVGGRNGEWKEKGSTLVHAIYYFKSHFEVHNFICSIWEFDGGVTWQI